MSFGKMRQVIWICGLHPTLDREGFNLLNYYQIRKIRAYQEGRHGSEKWASRASFTDATDLFRFRKIPDLEIDTSMYISTNDYMYNILSVEDIRGRGMYTEILARRVDPSGKSIVQAPR